MISIRPTLFSFEVGRFLGHPVHRAQQKSERKMPRDGCDQRCLVSVCGQNRVLEKRCKEYCKRILENKTRHCDYRVLILMRSLEGVGSFMDVSMYLLVTGECVS